MISENLLKIKENIEKASIASGRKADSITLVAVTKNVGIPECEALLSSEHNVFGENRVQSLLEKYDVLGDNATWHLIGHLQTNKVKYIIDKVSLIHSVDSIHLAEEIERLSKKQNKVSDILLQVNVSGEESKFGMPKEELFPTLEKLSSFENIKVRGLMTIPPVATFKGENRKYFKVLYDLFTKINNQFGSNICADYLSMGMSDDYEDAILEGANIVRVGRALYI
ncbi:MAG: YggS family pyridoxal phosphate-dependent enzyme [Clostridia bacterium]|nr:YggS family pyridoxal phosphate-dependent enzyme [Clostridia bacterium]MBR6646920.1 YggS family pyridoxal phosphate-dependent enzyme [Clostridia bacterium]